MQMITAKIAHSSTEAEGTSEKGAWRRSVVILAPHDANLTDTALTVIRAETFADEIPARGEVVSVLIDTRKRVVGTKMYENKIITEFIPLG